MSVIQCPTCEDFIDTDMEDYDFSEDMCEKCIFLERKPLQSKEKVI